MTQTKLPKSRIETIGECLMFVLSYQGKHQKDVNDVILMFL